MPITLGSNIASLRAQRTLSNNTASLSGVFERLSSGQRINRASDDAAGLAIADSLRSDAKLYSVAQRNINDGISMLNIISGSLGSQKGILLRLSELAEQSANGVFSSPQRQSLNSEYQSLLNEFSRIASSAEFNGQKLLTAGRDGAPSAIHLQAGIDGDFESILEVLAADTGIFSGLIATRDDVTGSDTIFPGDGPDGDVDIDDFSYFTNFRTSNPTFDELAEYANNNIFQIETVDSHGQTRTLLGIIGFGDYNSGTNRFSVNLFSLRDDNETYEEVGNVLFTNSDTASQNPYSISLSFEDGATGTADLDFRGLTVVTDNNNQFTQTSIDFTGVETQSRALSALEILRNRLEEISSIEGRFGAIQSRLQTASEVVSVSKEGSLAAESRIRDVDVATESAELVRLSILQQSSSAVLSQANSQPALSLLLLRAP
ncbi:MAG: flagellin [Bdellovibrionales bacterium]|nr:flagellin [Bdellovibrionales bacterium]